MTVFNSRNEMVEVHTLFKRFDSTKLDLLENSDRIEAHEHASCHQTFEEMTFSSGYLLLPPHASKRLHRTTQDELFCVVCQQHDIRITREGPQGFADGNLLFFLSHISFLDRSASWRS
jgi:hypothetical protein